MNVLHRKSLMIATAGALSFAGSSASLAQRDTSSRVAPVTAAITPAPITPRRAFFYSFLLPGYSQTLLGRHKAAGAFALVEAISLVMIRESAADVNEARRMTDDSVVVSYVDASGAQATTKIAPRFDGRDIRTRRAHIEDWVAFLVANHLFAGADAFVAAHLWDVPARLGLRVVPGRGTTVVAASLKW
jgi:predicted branched-subunit amino acid permease